MAIGSTAKHRMSGPASQPRTRSRRWAKALIPALAVITAATVAGGMGIASAADNPNPTVIVGGDPQGVAVDPDGKHVYVASFADNAVRVIDTRSQKVVGSIHVGANPRGIAVDPDSRHAFVTNWAENSVSVLDTASGKVIRTIGVGANPGSVAVFPRDHYAFVTNYYANNVSVINSSTLKVIGVIGVGVAPDGVAIDPKGEFAYVANSGSNSVSVIDIRAQRVARTILVGNGPQKVAVDADGKHAYVTNYGDHNVSVINLPSGLGDTAGVGGNDLLGGSNGPLGGSNGLLGGSGSRSNIDDRPGGTGDLGGLNGLLGGSSGPGTGGSGGAGDKNIYNTLLKVNATIPVGINPRGLALSRDSRHAFVVNVGDDTMSVIDTANGVVIRTVYVGFSPDEVAVGPDDTAYVTSRGDGTVTVVRPT